MVADFLLLGAAHDEGHRVLAVPAFAHVLDIAVIGRHYQRNAGVFGMAHERGQKLVVHPQHLARALVVHGVAADVGLEELEERKVVLLGDVKEVFGRALGRNHRNIGVALLDGFARDVLVDGVVGGEILGGGDGAGGGKRHYGSYALEAVERELFGAVDEVAVGKSDPLAPAAQLQKEVVVFDNLPEGRPGEALAVFAHRRGAVDAGEHGGLPGGALGHALHSKAGVDGFGVF